MSDTHLPVVTVVVPVYGDTRSLSDLLDAVAALDYPSHLVDVVLVDNHPAPTIALDRPGVRVVHQGVPGSYAARNAGVVASQSDVVAFTDADCQPHPGWLRQGIAALSTEPRTIIGGSIIVTTSADPSVAEHLEARYSLTQERYVREGYAATANLFIRRADLVTLGGFDESLFSGGDRELGYRAIARGFRYRYAPRATVDHRARTTARAVLAKTRRVTAGSAEVVRMHDGRLGLVRHLARASRPPVRRLARLLADDTLPALLRVQLAGLSLLDYAVGLWSSLRRVLPGSPPAPRA